MSDSELIQVIYTSSEAKPFTHEEILALLENIRPLNQAINVTGMLLYCDNCFFQVLEGRADKVRPLYEKVRKDPRHARVTKVIEEPIEARVFPDWSMGYSKASRDELAGIEGLNDFFSSASCLVDIDSGRAKKLLKAFEGGMWRS